MSSMKRRVLTPDEKADATRLSAAWLRYKREHEGSTQTWLAAESGLGTQGAVGQYLRGVIPLNIEALMAICKVLGVNPHSISPRLMDIVSGTLEVKAENTTVGGGLADSLKLTIETAAELRLLTVYRLTDERGRGVIDAAVDHAQRMLRLSGESNQA